MNYYWKRNGVYYFFVFMITVAFVRIFGTYIVKDRKELFRKGIKYACIINIVWGYLQVAFYKVLSVDINDLVFNQLFHNVQKASAFRDGVNLCASGFGWHPGLLIPIMIVSYCFFDGWFAKAGLVGLAVLSQNSTCLLGLLMCFAFDGTFSILDARKKRESISKKKTIEFISIIIVLLLLIVTNSSFLISIQQNSSKIISRIQSVINQDRSIDISTYLHARYYQFYPSIFKDFSLIEKLFGIGFDCSGYPYTMYLSQYTHLNAWIVESDPINFTVGRGLVWTVLFYVFMMRIAIKGFKLDKRYTIYVSASLVCGIFYNNQFEWVVLFEMLLFVSLLNGVNIWGDLSESSLDLKKKKNIKSL